MKKLQRLIEGMEKLGRGNWSAGLTKQLAIQGREQVQRTFKESKAPDGTRWKRLARRRGKPLMDTRRLYNSFIANSTARTFTIASNVVYAARQNFGWPRTGLRTMPPARPFMPDADFFPKRWEREFRRIARVYVANTLDVDLRNIK